MEKNNLIQDELKDISSAVANLNRRNVYSVPSGYFLNVANSILDRIKKDEAVIVFETTVTPFTVPQGYFESLSTQILSKVVHKTLEENEVVKELAEVAPFLNTLSKSNVYSVAEGFFDQLKARQEPAKVRSIGSFGKFTKYAAAAVITGILAFGGVFYMNNDNTSTTAVTNFNKEEIQKLSEQEIVEYLNANSTTGITNGTKPEADQGLIYQTNELSDEEIIEYLNENPEPGDAYQLEG